MWALKLALFLAYTVVIGLCGYELAVLLRPKEQVVVLMTNSNIKPPPPPEEVPEGLGSTRPDDPEVLGSIKEPPVGGYGSVINTHTRDANGRDLSSFSRGNGFSITWAGDHNPNGARLKDVTYAMYSRLKYLQTTRKGGDYVAQMLWDVSKLLDRIDEVDYPSQPKPKAQPSKASGAGFPEPEQP